MGSALLLATAVLVSLLSWSYGKMPQLPVPKPTIKQPARRPPPPLRTFDDDLVANKGMPVNFTVAMAADSGYEEGFTKVCREFSPCVQCDRLRMWLCMR